MMSNIPCILSVNNLYVLDDVSDGKKYVVLNSPDVTITQNIMALEGDIFSSVRLEDAFTILNHNKRYCFHKR